MNPLETVQKLIALATDASAAPEEARTAAMKAVSLIKKHELLKVGYFQPPPPGSYRNDFRQEPGPTKAPPPRPPPWSPDMDIMEIMRRMAEMEAARMARETEIRRREAEARSEQRRKEAAEKAEREFREQCERDLERDLRKHQVDPFRTGRFVDLESMLRETEKEVRKTNPVNDRVAKQEAMGRCPWLEPNDIRRRAYAAGWDRIWGEKKEGK